MSDNHPTIYLVRHGETDWSKSGQHTGRTDRPLTEEGQRQAERVRDILRKVSFSKVFTSPLTRAKETAAIAGLGSRATEREELAEFDYGDYEGLTMAQIREKVPGWTVWTHPCPNGETMEQAVDRANKLLKDIAGTTGSIVLFSHGHMLRILTCAYLGVPADSGKHLELGTCSVSILSQAHGLPTIKLWNSRDLD